MTARFLVWTDLHDELWGGFDLPELPDPIDAVLVGGDTNTQCRHLDIPARAARKYRCPVIVIWGNHECYGSVWSRLCAEEDRQLASLHAEGLDVRVLRSEPDPSVVATEVAGVRIVGATLWTDCCLYGPAHEVLARQVIGNSLTDYKTIRISPDKPFTVNDMLARHHRDRAAVFHALSRPFDGATVVMTHHLPIRDLIDPRYEIGNDAKRALNAGFASHLWSEIRRHDISYWICGHSHSNRHHCGPGEHGDIHFVMNARGYPGEDESKGFDPALTLTVPPAYEGIGAEFLGWLP